MHSRTLLVLSVLVAVFGAYIFFFEKESLSTDERRDQEKKVVVIENDDVEAIEIAWDEYEIRLEKEVETKKDDEGEGEDEDAAPAPPAEWRMAKPFTARADKAAVDTLLGAVGRLEKNRTLDDVARADAGLDDPRARLTLTTAEGETTIEVGPEVPATSDMLVAVAGGDAVYQVAKSFYTDLIKQPGDWRDKRLFTRTRADIDRLTLEVGAAKVLFARRGDDFWIESPLTDLADDTALSSLLSEVTGLTVGRFLDSPEVSAEEMGLEPPARVLEVVLAGDDEPFRLELGRLVDEMESAAESKRVFARFEGQVVEVTTRMIDAFAKTPEAWRSRAWTAVESFRVDSARIEGADGIVAVARDGSDWRRGEDKMPYSAVSDVLYAVTDVKAEEVLNRADAASRGHAMADAELRITLDTTDASETLALYPAVDGLYAAEREGREAVLLLSSTTVDELRGKIQELRDAEPEKDEAEKDEAEEDGEDDGEDEG